MKDLARIYVKAGNGGNGSVHFRHEKFAPKGGPDGGDGGRGGDVILVADENIESLVEFNFQKKFEAKNGEQGYGKKMHGADMPDIRVHVPVGTMIWEIPSDRSDADMRERSNFEEIIASRKLLMDMKEHGVECIVAYGGKGGKGNWRFRSSSNQTPMEHEDGKPGEGKWLLLEFKVVADVGIVGLPNAGKSSILKALTHANPKIAGYPFTTLEPNLGVMTVHQGKESELNEESMDDKKTKRLVLVDVPGVVEEAWEGKGIGPWFLRHLERTKSLLHVIAPNVNNLTGSELVKQLASDYSIVHKELEKYGNGLAEKPELVVVNKRELIESSEWKKVAKDLKKKIKKEVVLVSAAMNEGLEQITELV